MASDSDLLKLKIRYFAGEHLGSSPVINTCPDWRFHSTRRSPPGRCTVTSRLVRPVSMAATAVAHALCRKPLFRHRPFPKPSYGFRRVKSLARIRCLPCRATSGELQARGRFPSTWASVTSSTKTTPWGFAHRHSRKPQIPTGHIDRYIYITATGMNTYRDKIRGKFWKPHIDCDRNDSTVMTDGNEMQIFNARKSFERYVAFLRVMMVVNILYPHNESRCHTSSLPNRRH